MGYIPPDPREGDEFTIDDIRAIYAELRRWNKLSARGQIRVHNANNDSPPVVEGILPQPFSIRITTTGDANGNHSWSEVFWGVDANGNSAYVLTGVSSDGTNTVDPAREVNGLKCPRGDEVYYAWRSWQGDVTFKAVRAIGVASADINANSNGTVYLWSEINGTLSNTSNSITVFNWNDTTKVTSGKRVMLTPHSTRWLVDFEVC
jgi:hypothetical protein